jgi:Transcriptional regulators
MRFSLENDIFAPSNTNNLIANEDDVFTSRKKFLNIYLSTLKDTILQLNDRHIKLAANAIQDTDMLHIYASSPGSNAITAYQLFLQIGIPCTYFTDTAEAMMSAPHLKKGDTVIGINYSGTAADLLEIMTIAKNSGATIIAITAYMESPIAKISDIALYYSVQIEDDLRYRHIARMCEIAIIGQLQSAIINGNPQKFQKYLDFAKRAVQRIRK